MEKNKKESWKHISEYVFCADFNNLIEEILKICAWKITQSDKNVNMKRLAMA